MALAAFAFVGCQDVTDENPNLPWDYLEVPADVVEGNGTLTSPVDDYTGTSTYSYKADGTDITIEVNVSKEDLLATIDAGQWEIGHFTLPVNDINNWLGDFVSNLDETTFVAYEPDGTAVEEMTSYKPGMWVDADGKSSGSSGYAFWQWYIWGGKTDKNGDEITYDYDYAENPGLFMVGGAPSNFASCSGLTIKMHNVITMNGTDYNFDITFKYAELGDLPEPTNEVSLDYVAVGNAYAYRSAAYGFHQATWQFTETGVVVDVDAYVPSIKENEDWAFLLSAIDVDAMVEYLGVDSIDKLADFEYFHPVLSDGATVDGTAWTSYAPGQWVDADGAGVTYDSGVMFWQYQFGDCKYEGHTTEGLLVIGTNPANVDAVADKTVTSKAVMGDKSWTVNVHFHSAYPTSGEGVIGKHSYSWTLGDTQADIVANVSASAINEWTLLGFAINENCINAKYGIDIDAMSQDYSQFYPVDAEGNAYEKWTSYTPGVWFTKDGAASTWEAGMYWQYYTYSNYDYDLDNLFVIGDNPDYTYSAGEQYVSKAKLGSIDWVVTINIVE